MLDFIADMVVSLGELSSNNEKGRNSSNGCFWIALVLIIVFVLFCISLFFIN